MDETGGFNEPQRRRLLASARYADKLAAEIEEILRAPESKSPFAKYRPDVSLHQARLIRSHLARFGEHLGRVLSAAGIECGVPQFGALHSIRVDLAFLRIAVQEMAPEYLRGYGDLPPATAAELRGLCGELEGHIDGLERNLALGSAADLQARLARLDGTTKEADLLRALDRIAGETELAEFRATLLHLVEKAESQAFEVAVFGRVSSGKSTLLNRLLDTDVLPVGVNPITAVPTRLVHGPESRLTVTFVDREVRRRPIAELIEYASEERNPGNQLGVTRLVLSLPSQGLENGLVLVDTPGLGALATNGAAETLSYLPQCDLGIVLISALNPVNDEDLNTIQALTQAGIAVMALLSKADLLSPGDREKVLRYTKNEIFAHLGLATEVYPVSAVRDGEGMLDEWRTRILSPLFERHRELAQQSLRRKAGALRESVIAALRVRLDAEGKTAPAAASLFGEVERELRTAAGELEDARRFCLGATDEVRSLYEFALARAAKVIVESGGKRPPVEIVRETAEALAADAASQISGRLIALAEHLQNALRAAAEALGEDTGTLDPELEQSVREMPRFQPALPDIAIASPRYRGLRAVARAWVARSLRSAVSAELQTGFTNYGRNLETWVRSVLGALQQGFNERADPYRARLARQMGGSTLPADRRERMQSGIEELERLG